MHLFTHYLAQFYTLNSSFSLQVFTLKVYCSSEWDLIASEEERLIFPDLCHHNCIRTLPVLFIQCQCMENYEKKYRNWCVGLVLHFGQKLLIWSDIQLKSSKEHWARIAVPWWNPISFFVLWLLHRRGIILVCGAEPKMFINMDFWVQLCVDMWMVKRTGAAWRQAENNNNQCFSHL